MKKKFTGKHPLFRDGRPERSPYYFWWEFLRRSGYDNTSPLYPDFGELGSDFKRWWRSTGEDLFCEPPVQSLHIVSQAQDHIVLYVPLTLNKGSLRRRFRWVLEKVHGKKKGGKVFAGSRARYPLSTNPVTKALAKALRVYDLRNQHNDWTLAQVGREAGVAWKTKDGETVDNETLAINVRRYINHARSYIKNVARGRFPVK